MNEQQYVLGFAFNLSGDRVALVRKARPDWQAGKLNGFGGKVEPGETPHAAMHREFLEETGQHAALWQHFARLQDPGTFRVDCFWTFAQLDQLRSTNDEPIVRPLVAKLGEHFLVPGVSWLIPLALSHPGTTSPDFVVAHYNYNLFDEEAKS